MEDSFKDLERSLSETILIFDNITKNFLASISFLKDNRGLEKKESLLRTDTTVLYYLLYTYKNKIFNLEKEEELKYAREHLKECNYFVGKPVVIEEFNDQLIEYINFLAYRIGLLERQIKSKYQILKQEMEKCEKVADVEEEVIMDINEVSKLIGLSKPCIYAYVQKDKIPFYKKYGKLYFIKSEIINWIKEK